MKKFVAIMLLGFGTIAAAEDVRIKDNTGKIVGNVFEVSIVNNLFDIIGISTGHPTSTGLEGMFRFKYRDGYFPTHYGRIHFELYNCQTSGVWYFTVDTPASGPSDPFYAELRRGMYLGDEYEMDPNPPPSQPTSHSHRDPFGDCVNETFSFPLPLSQYRRAITPAVNTYGTTFEIN